MQETSTELGRNAINRVVFNNITVCQTNEGCLTLPPQSGVAPGLHNATNMFNHAYGKVLSKYYSDVRPETSLLRVRSPLNDVEIDMAHSSFVDDLCSTAATYDCT